MIDGFGPLPQRQPASVDELGEMIRKGAEGGRAVYPLGGRTSLGIGLPPNQPGYAYDLTQLNKVIDYPARDMTITVQTGLTVAALRNLLNSEKQRLPVDLPGDDKATIGGAIALNRSGPRRLGLGTLRDYVIGISFMTDDGVEVKAGGRVVKNVAGYDLMKLQIGAMGTLGVLTQVTLKVFPRPEAQAIVAFGLNAASIGPTLDRLHESASRPMMLEVLNGAAARHLAASTGLSLPANDPWVVLVGFEEKPSTVAWQVTTLLAELRNAPVRDLGQLPAGQTDALIPALTSMQDLPDAKLSFRATILPSRVAAFLNEASGLAPDLVLHSHAGNGIIWGHSPGLELSLDRASVILNKLTDLAYGAQGNLVVRRCPADWKKVLPYWGRARSDRDVMRTIKTTLDPKNLFNPGRLFGDL